MVKVEYEDHFLYNDDELAEYVKEEGPAEEKTKTLDHIEFYEAREIEKIIDKIERLGVDIGDYDVEEEAEISGAPKKESKKDAKKPKYSIKIEKKAEGFLTLKEILKFVMDVGKEGMSIQRYKGLGEMNPEQLWETTMDPEKRTLLKVTLEDAVAADEMFTVLMGEAVEPRREFIEKHAHEVKVLDI
jgi:DNA gyrase subunit B